MTTGADNMNVEGYARLPREALLGTEYGGVDSDLMPMFNTIQPKPADTFTAGDKLRLGYTVGVEDDYRALEDRRQMLGLRPADGRRPEWLIHTSPTNRPELLSEAQLQGYEDIE